MDSSGRTTWPRRRPSSKRTHVSLGSCIAAYSRIFLAAVSSAALNSFDTRDSAARHSCGAIVNVWASRLSNLRAYSSTASSPRFRTSSRMGATICSASASRTCLRVMKLCASLSGRIFSMRSHHDLVQRIFDDSLPPSFLEPRNDVSDSRFVENGVNRYPLVVAQCRDGWFLKRRKNTEDRGQTLLANVEYQA